MSIKAAYMVPHPPLIVPEIGRGQEREIKATIDSYQRIAEEIREINPDTIVIVSPHSVMYADYFHISPGAFAEGDFGDFRAPQVTFRISYDKEFSDALTTASEKSGIAAGFLGEKSKRLDHGTMVPLYFIKKAYQDQLTSKFVRIGLSGFSFEEHYQFGQLIQKVTAELGRNIVLIASGDLSHRLKEDGPYGYQEEGPVYDAQIMEYASNADFLSMLLMKENFCDLAGECGQRSFCIMAGALDGIEVKSEKLSYEGPFGVGYGVVSFHPVGKSEDRRFLERALLEKKERVRTKKEKEDSFVKLARASLEAYVEKQEKIKLPEGLSKELTENRAGCFVSLKKNGKLRGCIGTIEPTRDSLAEEIIENAISAATRDPRFEPVVADELELLEVSVDVLGEPCEITSEDELDVKRYGVIVTKGYKRGLLLPNLEGVDTVSEQLKIAKQKAGIGEFEKVRMERFEVVRHF